MSLNGKFISGVLLCFIVVIPAQAQWRGAAANSPMNGSVGRLPCRDISLTVTDANGIAIMGADIVTENQGLEITTDSLGFAAIPCHAVGRNFLSTVTVRAPGYKAMQVNLVPDVSSRLEVHMDRGENLGRLSAGATVNASELRVDVQKRSARLQSLAEKALADKDYDGAEKLLAEALQLTPSTASIANNIGILALRRKDIDGAALWFQKASDEAPYKQPDILGNLGLVRWMQRQYQESYTVLTKAYAQGYQSGFGNYIMGTMELRLGNTKDAIEHLKRASADSFPDRDLYLSLALRRCGKQKAADESYRAFLKHNPAPLLVYVLR